VSEHVIHVRCAPGLEDLVAGEIRALGAEPEVRRAGVRTAGDDRLVQRLNLELACAQLVQVRVAERKAKSLDELEQRVGSMAWNKWVAPHHRLTIEVKTQSSRLHHRGEVEDRVRRALGERIGGWANPQGDPLELEVRARGDRVSFWMNTTGDILHRRGYRLETAKAPLREDLAAALIRVSDWDGTSAFADPMMGAGTLVIEAARMARGIAPGADRSFAFERFAGFDADGWAELRAAAKARVKDTLPFPIFGSDRDAGALGIATRNAERGGVVADLSLATAAISAAPVLENPPAQGTLVTNPPWGGRLGKGKDLRPLYQTLEKLADQLPGWGLAFVATKDRLAQQVRGVREALRTTQGGRDVTFYRR